MKMLPFIGLFLGMGWGLYRVVVMMGQPANTIIGEGECYFVVIALPMFVIGMGHSIFLSINSRFPLFYGLGIGGLLISEAIPYRLHFPDGNTVASNSLLLLTAIILAGASACLFFIVPLFKWLLGRLYASRW